MVAFKNRSVYGILLHSIIIFIAQALFLLPYLFSGQVWLMLVILTLAHFGIDYSKIKIKKPQKFPIIPFLLDQLAHFMILFLVYSALKNSLPILFLETWWFESLYQNKPLLIYTIGIILSSYTLDIVFLTIKLQKKPDYKYERGYFDMLIRVAIFALIYVLYNLIFR